MEFQLDRRLQGLHGVMLKHRNASVAFNSRFFKIAGIKLWFLLHTPQSSHSSSGCSSKIALDVSPRVKRSAFLMAQILFA